MPIYFFRDAATLAFSISAAQGFGGGGKGGERKNVLL